MVVWTTINGVRFVFLLQNTLRNASKSFFIFVLHVGVIQSACNSQQDKPKEIEMQLEYINLLMGQPEEESHVWHFKSIVQYLYCAVTMYSRLNWNTMHLRSFVTETRAYIPCSARPCCTRSPGEAYTYHVQSEERNQYVSHTSKPHSRDYWIHLCSWWMHNVHIFNRHCFGLRARSRMQAIIIFINSILGDVSKPVSLMQSLFHASLQCQFPCRYFWSDAALSVGIYLPHPCKWGFCLVLEFQLSVSVSCSLKVFTLGCALAFMWHCLILKPLLWWKTKKKKN